MPNMLLYLARRGAQEAAFDWGAGRWRGRWRAQDLTLVPPGSAADVMLSERHSFLALCLPEAMLDGDTERFAPLFAAPFRDRLVAMLCEALWSEAEDGGAEGRLFADHAVQCVLARLNFLAGRADGKGGPAKLPRPALRRVVAFTEAHLERNIGVADMAQIAGYAPARFTQLFRVA
ncbi:hypothetical protein, partial [Tabrizicola sp.]|uniref:hypothetical protein n=1 Tax=Tabrizicola sp. TaxID=2005166 RepID=UPI003F313977